MSKVNVDEIEVDEIEVGDLVGLNKQIGLVTRIEDSKVWAYWSSYKDRELHCDSWEVTGHWKVINFNKLPVNPFTEEEKQMNDELKVYTGKETIEALLEGKILKTGTINYKLTEDGLQVDYLNGKGWETSFTDFNNIVLVHEFTEVVTPQVGDWVRVTTHLGNTRTGQVNDIKGNAMKAVWSDNNLDSWITLGHDGWTYEILTPEQVSEYKREQAFAKVGRKLNEFKIGDIVLIDTTGTGAVVVSRNNQTVIQLHGINQSCKGYTAKPHQLTPISFVEQQVSLD